MSTPKTTGSSVDGAGSILSTVSGPSTGTLPKNLGKDSQTPAELLQKFMATAALAASMPSNPNKAAEYEPDPHTLPEGVHKSAGLPLASASTVTESAASPKLGDGKPELGFNATIGSLDRVRSDAGGQTLTTNQGVAIADNQNSLKIGLRGPTALEDFILREKITHFDHERNPERVVHARGSGAHGFFESYNELSHLTKAAPLAEAGKRTPVFVRFSTVVGERGSADTVRDVRGFAVKFYTDEGVWDLVGNNIPVFFIQDAMKFPDLVHAVKPEPHHAIPQASSAHDTFWDFASLMPESTHMLLWQMSDRAIPRSYRMMQGFGVHTFRLINAAGESVFCKFHWTPKAGTHALVWEEAVKLAGADPDFHRRDLWESIEAGVFPEYELGLQIFSEAQADAFTFDVLDSTKLIPEELVPVIAVGRLILNRNPDNFFAETEQVAFCTAHVIPGIDFTNDPLLQGRIHSYIDTQISRLGGPNFHEIPINSPVNQVHNNQREGLHRQAIHRGRVAYEPNSLGGGCPFQAGALNGFTSFPEPVAADKMRGKPERFAEHFAQATMFWISQTEVEQNHIVNAFIFELTKVQTPAIRERVVSLLVNVNTALAQRVADGLGIGLPTAAPVLLAATAEIIASPALSMLSRPGDGAVHGRRVAILVGEGVDGAVARRVYSALLAAGVVPRYVGRQLGQISAGSDKNAGAAINIEISIAAGPAVLYDAVVIAGSAQLAKTLGSNGQAMDFVKDQYRHCKPMLVLGGAIALLDHLHIPRNLPTGEADPGIVAAQDDDPSTALSNFLQALSTHRPLARETTPPRV